MTFAFDTSDPQVVGAHLAELRSALAAKLGERDQLSVEIQQLQDLIRVGEGLSRRGGRIAASPGLRQQRRRREAPAQDRAVRALEQASADRRELRSAPPRFTSTWSSAACLSPKDPTVLGTDLWDAWRAGRIRRATNGVYLPLDHTGATEVDYPLTDYYYAAEQGLPVPSRLRRRS